MIIPAECVVSSNNSIIPVCEKKCTFRLINISREYVEKVTVDDCAIKEGDKCDFLFRVANELDLFVELKGSDVKHAIKQLEISIGKLGNVSAARKLAVVVAFRCPLVSTEIQTEGLKFKKRTGYLLEVKGPRYEFSL